MRKPRLRHWIEYGLFRVIEAGLGALGRRGSERVGQFLGDLIYFPLRVRRRVVEENLRRAFPDANDQWIARTARDTYRHLGREAAAMLRLSRLDKAAVQATVEIPPEDWQAFLEARAEGRGVILATGHYGNWEMAAAGVAARGIPMGAIVKRLSNPLIDRRIQQARASLGIDTIEMRQASRAVPRALLREKGIGIVADQDARRSGVFVPFFGVPASTHRGPALFALRLGAPIFAAVARRRPDGTYYLYGTRLSVERTDSLEDDVTRLTATLAAHLESEIRKDPTQYFWFHKRWKTAPPEEHLLSESGSTTYGGVDEDA